MVNIILEQVSLGGEGRGVRQEGASKEQVLILQL